jgi:hypothetical protein
MTLLAYEHGDMFRMLACSFNLQIHPVWGPKCEEKPRIIHHHGNI